MLLCPSARPPARPARDQGSWRRCHVTACSATVHLGGIRSNARSVTLVACRQECPCPLVPWAHAAQRGAPMSVDREVRPGTFPEFDPDDRSSNPSGNRPFRDVLAARVSRRDVLRGGTVAQVLIPWGTPIRSSGPAWRKDASNTAAEQARQIGMHHDGMHPNNDVY